MDMICFSKPVLTEDLYMAKNEEFSITCYMCDTYFLTKAKLIHKDKPILSPERI
jgi:hypothetical protein